MEKNLEILDRLYNLRYRSGKVHLFHSINKLVGRFGNVVSLDKIYVSKEYLSYLSEKLFKEKAIDYNIKLKNLFKDENISDTIKYTDHFIDSQTLVAMSKSKMKLNSKGMEIFNKAKERNTFIHIFVRKNKDDKVSKEFYYLGQGNIIDIKQETMANDVPVCEILYQLDQPVRQDIYDYIVNN